MISRVLVPMDDSEIAEEALNYAIEAHPEADITVLHVVGEPSPMLGSATGMALEGDLESALQERSEVVLDRARQIAADADMEIETEVDIGHPAKIIVERAEAFDTVVIGSHSGSMADRLFVGDVATRVFRRSPVPVTTVR